MKASPKELIGKPPIRPLFRPVVLVPNFVEAPPLVCIGLSHFFPIGRIIFVTGRSDGGDKVAISKDVDFLFRIAGGFYGNAEFFCFPTSIQSDFINHASSFFFLYNVKILRKPMVSL